MYGNELRDTLIRSAGDRRVRNHRRRKASLFTASVDTREGIKKGRSLRRTRSAPVEGMKRSKYFFYPNIDRGFLVEFLKSRSSCITVLNLGINLKLETNFQ